MRSQIPTLGTALIVMGVLTVLFNGGVCAAFLMGVAGNALESLSRD